MKKKLIVTVLALSTALSLAACGQNSSSESVSRSSSDGTVVSESADTSVSDSSIVRTDSEKAAMALPLVDDGWELGDCIELGNYKGMKLTKKVEEVTEDDILSYIYYQEAAEEITDGEATVQKWDTVNIAYVGTKDGEEFEGGSSDSYDLMIGSGSFIDGFEDGLIGMKKGQTRALDLTFPDDYSQQDLAGQKVVFTVTVNSISRPAAITDDWVASNTDGQYQTVDDYKKYVRETLEEETEQAAEEELKSDAWTNLVDGSTFLQLPKSYVEEAEETFEMQTSDAAEQDEKSLEDFLTENGYTMEQYNTAKELYGRESTESRLVLEAFCEAEKITTDSDEYRQKLEEEAALYGVSSDSFLSQYGEEQVSSYILSQTAAEKLVSYAEVSEEKGSAENSD